MYDDVDMWLSFPLSEFKESGGAILAFRSLMLDISDEIDEEFNVVGNLNALY